MKKLDKKKDEYIREGRSMDISDTINRLITIFIKLKNKVKQ